MTKPLSNEVADVFKLVADGARSAAECGLSLKIASENCKRAASAYLMAAVAQERLALDATSYWRNVALFTGMATLIEEIGFSDMVGDFLLLAEAIDES